MRRLPLTFPSALPDQLASFGHYQRRYPSIPVTRFWQFFLEIWDILDGRLDAISFDYYIKKLHWGLYGGRFC